VLDNNGEDITHSGRRRHVDPLSTGCVHGGTELLAGGPKGVGAVASATVGTRSVRNSSPAVCHTGCPWWA
jgi:hypothetical protein